GCFATEHQEFLVQANMTDALPKILWHYDQPFADPSALPSYFVAKETRRAVTVALNGDGGDEAFGGYLRYLGDYWSLQLSRQLPIATAHLGARALRRLPGSDSRTLQYAIRLAEALHPNVFETNFRLFCYFNPDQRRELYQTAWMSQLDHLAAREHSETLARRSAAEHPMDQILAADYHGYLPDCLLVKMDIASMSNSLETRSPFLDHRLVEFAACLPFEWKVKGLTTKWILRQAAAKILPKEILSRRKTGFGVPVHRWFRCDLKNQTERLLLDPKAASRRYFNNERVRRLLLEHSEGRKNHGYRLWALLCFEIWHRLYIDKTLKPSDCLSTI
ncbi:MAG: asparagine synthase C-terminal domain-containing protein, partial [Elusimicrobiota bacterium]